MAEIDWVHKGLFEWADFVRDNRQALGYPSQSAEQGMVGNGGDVADGYMPDGVMVMERAVLCLPDEFQAAVKIRYMCKLDSQADRARWLSRELDKPISRRRFGEMIYYSQLVIAGVYAGLDMGSEKSIDIAAQKP